MTNEELFDKICLMLAVLFWMQAFITCLVTNWIVSKIKKKD